MMETTSIYQDMAQRTGGSVYIGVVGPVRTGKSTFVKRFMETLVLPHIENSYRREIHNGSWNNHTHGVTKDSIVIFDALFHLLERNRVNFGEWRGVMQL